MRKPLVVLVLVCIVCLFCSVVAKATSSAWSREEVVTFNEVCYYANHAEQEYVSNRFCHCLREESSKSMTLNEVLEAMDGKNPDLKIKLDNAKRVCLLRLDGKFGVDI